MLKFCPWRFRPCSVRGEEPGARFCNVAGLRVFGTSLTPRSFRDGDPLQIPLPVANSHHRRFRPDWTPPCKPGTLAA
ncbi:unnamed protein product [Ciceribacter selenitireducens ATCC BAA-1503]|uniref:Uncharacterized protein n=1 Tax=Ciceribacter selenitireducens ATCC BAA-1503 TaxID=1336235 RepID=A0A376AHI0_9HYPH|nr:unnamed protein product [Ciceribacter selenitireducens ATCC BAA-1503]